eukprot:CAMPEP_0184864556 /NCGR_PEP_ID=MMETSP0580-20130426/15389_1 /TAXON_ID=1118495 /ORGANISM="Dactyliosolen fragilissimus" /LENGTH=506 /DNA_ID=CAMNT_0027363407 /DNA_START=34 /DNA_END=1554 /DNA_ORIENTATION=-
MPNIPGAVPILGQWGSTGGVALGATTAPGPTIQQQQPQQQQQKHDIFVGNLAFSTTEEQLHQAFSELGRIIKVRMVNDLETGKPRGFAFIEFEDPQVALSAIRNMNDYELNGRKIRVNFSNSSHLETLAGKLGMDMGKAQSSITPNQMDASSGLGMQGSSSSSMKAMGDMGTQAVADALKSMNKGEMYDIIKKLKDIADRDPDEARKIISAHPQLPEAILHLMSRLEMIQTPVNNNLLGMNMSAMNAINPTANLPPPDASSLPMPPMQLTSQTTTPLSIPSRPTADPRAAMAAKAAVKPTNTTTTTHPTPPLPINTANPSTTTIRRDPRARSDPRAARQPTSNPSFSQTDNSNANPVNNTNMDATSNTAANKTAKTLPPPPVPHLPPPPPPPPPPHAFAQPPPPQPLNAPSTNATPSTVPVPAIPNTNATTAQPPPIPLATPPPPPPPPGTTSTNPIAIPGVAALDPALVQQVMGLTNSQIAQLPPDKQGNILALRQQISNTLQHP